jgi:hypothetical protein
MVMGMGARRGNGVVPGGSDWVIVAVVVVVVVIVIVRSERDCVKRVVLVC